MRREGSGEREKGKREKRKRKEPLEPLYPSAPTRTYSKYPRIVSAADLPLASCKPPKTQLQVTPAITITTLRFFTFHEAQATLVELSSRTLAERARHPTQGRHTSSQFRLIPRSPSTPPAASSRYSLCQNDSPCGIVSTSQ